MDGPPKVKSRLLDRLIEQCKPAALYAFESNKETRKMFRSRKVTVPPHYGRARPCLMLMWKGSRTESRMTPAN